MYSKHEATRLGAELADVLCEFWPQAEGISMAVAPAFDWQFPTSQVFQTRWGGGAVSRFTVQDAGSAWWKSVHRAASPDKC